MKTIETPYALTALRKMAQYTPVKLCNMEKEDPGKLLEEIEIRVTNALGWIDTAIGKGADKRKMEDMLDQLLKPESISCNNESQPISEQRIQEIHQKLISLAGENKFKV